MQRGIFAEFLKETYLVLHALDPILLRRTLDHVAGLLDLVLARQERQDVALPCLVREATCQMASKAHTHACPDDQPCVRWIFMATSTRDWMYEELEGPVRVMMNCVDVKRMDV